MFSLLLKKQNVFKRFYLNPCKFTKNNLKHFTQTNSFLYPDQIIEKMKQGENLEDIEDKIITSLNFFDVDQYVDIVIYFSRHNLGTVDLWDCLERRAYNFEFNEIQIEEMIFAQVRPDSLVMSELLLKKLQIDKLNRIDSKEQLDTYKQLI